MRCRPAELLLLAVLLAPAGARADPSGLPALASATGDRAAFATFVERCAARLAVTESGLARVARACPGIDVVLADGPFAASLPEHWARRVDAAMLARLRDLARSFEARPQPARGLRRDVLDAHLRELRGEARRPVGLWERLAAWYEELTRRREREDDPRWLRDFLTRIGWFDADNRWVEFAIYALAIALVIALVVTEGRAQGWWARRRGLPPRRATERAPPGASPAVASADDPSAELARRFDARLGELHSAGLVARPRTITCRELARLDAAGGAPVLAAVVSVAPVVEAARYAARRPAPAEIESALARLTRSAGPALAGAPTGGTAASGAGA